MCNKLENTNYTTTTTTTTILNTQYYNGTQNSLYTADNNIMGLFNVRKSSTD
jgi:hypothetical protein